MLQSELNSYWSQTILYYCYQINNAVFFDKYASTCGTYGYDGSGNLIITSWAISGSPNTIAQPSNSTLLGYTLSTVLTFYNEKYLWPQSIIDHQPLYQIATADLANIPSARLIYGNLVYDTTSQSVKQWTPILGWVAI